MGCEEALQLADRGYHVTIVEMQEELAAECGRMHRLGLLHEVEARERISVAVGMRCTAITETAVSAVNTQGTVYSFDADWVVMAAGMRARTAEVERLRALVPECYVIGDGKATRNIRSAVREGYEAATALGL